MDYDIVIIGGGPVGLSFACSMIKSKLKVLLVEKAPLIAIANPKADGREIALTHQSRKVLNELGVWSLIDQDEVSPLKEAKVFDGNSPSLLSFNTNKSAIDALGYLVPNQLIRKALFERATHADNIEIINEVSVEDVSTSAASAKIELSDGRTIEAKLIVAADSRFSEIRRKMGIPSLMRDFSKVMITTRMTHEKPHNHIALECFNYGHTLALLPMNGDVSSVVLTVPANKADEMLNLNEDDFNALAAKGFNNKLGTMKQVGERHSYPLVGVHAQRFKANRFALIGDAAVGMHPVTAHGFNLGLRGQNILAESVYEALGRGGDIGATAVLARFEKKQINLTRLMFFGTNGIVALFTNDDAIAKQVRRFVLKFADKFPPVKALITQHLTESKKSNLLPF
ncbi:MAG: 5-demethoxyubiquinol-8 5-hydroxylase UbiM [Gammaproteobacteria bacterium]|nr:5-demethoxyubiquinol-8 5-hydroxylase UbiM [Gammaproteobacteria bacterium]